MNKDKNYNPNNISAMEKVNKAIEGHNENREDALDSEKRVKILSPGMLVFKRFMRNKLAITGIIILIVMFLFAFVGPIFSPYTQTQIFTKVDYVDTNYASAVLNKELRATTVDGSKLQNNILANFNLAVNKNDVDFVVGKNAYLIEKISDQSYKIQKSEILATMLAKGGNLMYPIGNPLFTDNFKLAFETAHNNKENTFVFNNENYSIIEDRIELSIGKSQDYALMSRYIYNAYTEDLTPFVDSFGFRYNVEKSVAANSANFSYDNKNYTIEVDEDDIISVYDVTSNQKNPISTISDVIVMPANKNEFLSIDFVNEVKHNIAANNDRFMFTGLDQEGNQVETEYKISLSNANYAITSVKPRLLQNIYGAPSDVNLLGTDEKGMDMFTRLMYGGRISLMVGFVVVFLEILIGVVFGGISGYFGGWVDNLLMRFVDLFNSIPTWPMLIIFGSVMDTKEIDSTTRIFLLMLVLGLMGWTGIARIVRGQILSLREQDFMVATEATGLSINKRIFRHLVPNVMPLLIVQATMSLGSIIITEATLSFLGLGVKPPIASWGSIINAANNLHVMQSCWWVWLPTGFLIVFTVLGFNFVGDGLRDAFDPKMKR